MSGGLQRLANELKHSGEARAYLSRGRQILKYPGDMLVRLMARSDALMENASLSAKLYAYRPASSSFILPDDALAERIVRDDDLPVPPPDLWEGYGPTLDDYLSSGREHFDNMISILGEAGFALAPGQRALDFGCSAGLIRYFADKADACEIRGVDISAQHILWCWHNLTPPFHFTNTTTLPHLPFEDNYFDLIYSGSVFTHISDLADAWLLELRRVLRPSGMLYITVHDDHTVNVLKADLRDYYLTRLVLNYEAETDLKGRPWHMFAIRRSPRAAMVFYHSDYLREEWGRELTVRSIIREAYGY
jgi:ubiquinone/menaquinone biosynthesis C-methylase UbiE